MPKVLQTSMETVLDATVNGSRKEFTYGQRWTILVMKRLERKVFWAKLKDTDYWEMSSLHSNYIHSYFTPVSFMHLISHVANIWSHIHLYCHFQLLSPLLMPICWETSLRNGRGLSMQVASKFNAVFERHRFRNLLPRGAPRQACTDLAPVYIYKVLLQNAPDNGLELHQLALENSKHCNEKILLISPCLR